MANKKQTTNSSKSNTKSSGNNTKVGKKAVKSAKKAVKKEIKRNKGLQIALIVLVVAIVVAVVALYLFKPDVFNSILSMLTGKDNTPPTTSGGGGDAAIQGITPIQGNMLQVTFVNVGQGDGIFIQFPDGKTMIMDMGKAVSGGQKGYYEDNLVPLLASAGVTQLDYVFVTHTDLDHVSEIDDVINDYEVKNFYLPKAADDTTGAWNKVITGARNEKYNLDGTMTDATINYNVDKWNIEGDGWIMKCFSYDEADYPSIGKGSTAKVLNSVSPLCVLQYGGRTIVLSGDSNEKNEKYFLDKGYLNDIDCDVYKLPHHGANNTTAAQVFNAIDPEYCVISVGEGNSHGHPTQEALDLMTGYVDLNPDTDFNGIEQVYRTDRDGNVVVQVGENGTLNLISTNNSDSNRTQTTLSIVATVYRVDIYCTYQKQEEIEQKAA
ncbi:MAG: hypothetical protein SO434_08110 [Eubacteriales bacterium]|nr:hypothetical protein [Eubacteriales bacterium]